MSEGTRALFEGFDHVEAPDYEWPGDGDGLNLLRQKMSLPTLELTSLTLADDLLCISQRSGPVKILAKGFFDQRPWGHVMSADSSMDLKEELFPLVSRDALHEYT